MNKIIYACIAWLLVIAFSACNSANKTQVPVKEFEGVITFKTTYSTWRDSGKTPYSDTLRVYYSHGNILRIHSGDSSVAPKKEIYQVNDDRFYSIQPHVDTLYWYDITKNPDMELAELKVTPYPQAVLGRKCDQVSVLIKYTGASRPYYVEHDYIFSKGYLPVDKKNLSNFKYGYFNQAIDSSGSYCLKYQYKMYLPNDSKILMNIQYEAINVKEEKLNPNIFTLNNFPRKQM
ncbi:hypothetical protein ACFGVR_11745 [Mucilaginibacter sp. AW1-3]